MLSLWLERPRVIYLATGWTCVIGILSAIPGKDLPTIDIFQSDKLIHAFMYGVMCWLWIRAMALTWKKSLIISVVSCSLFGMGMEVMQETFYESRYFDWMDVIANEMGILLAPILFRKRT